MVEAALAVAQGRRKADPYSGSAYLICACTMFLGPVKFFSFDLIGAIVWGVMTALYAWLFRALWTMDLRGWLFVIVLAGLNLSMDGISILGASTLAAMLPSLIVNTLILIYALSPGVKEAFDWEGKRS